MGQAPQNVYVLNGPNLNLLGTREPEIYGSQTLNDIESYVRAHAKNKNIDIVFYQSNSEGQLVDWIQEARTQANGLIINPAAYSHTSIALLDALLSLEIPAIEVHLSNIFRREDFRHHSYISKGVQGIISGLGTTGYVLAVDALAEIFRLEALSSSK